MSVSRKMRKGFPARRRIKSHRKTTEKDSKGVSSKRGQEKKKNVLRTVKFGRKLGGGAESVAAVASAEGGNRRDDIEGIGGRSRVGSYLTNSGEGVSNPTQIYSLKSRMGTEVCTPNQIPLAKELLVPSRKKRARKKTLFSKLGG